MERIKWAIELGSSVNGNTPEELLTLLEYYYNQDHLKSCLIASLLLEMDLLPNNQKLKKEPQKHRTLFLVLKVNF